MVVSTGTKRSWPLKNLGPLTEQYSLVSDKDDVWLTGGLEPDVIAEAQLDTDSIFNGILKFANDRKDRITRQNNDLNSGN